MKTDIIAVIHYADDEQAMRNAERAHDAGCAGVLLIHMEGRNALLPPAAHEIRKRWPTLAVGLNLLGEEPARALEISIGAGLDMTWTDEQLTHSDGRGDADARAAAEVLAQAPGHLLFAGVAFKHQRPEPDPAGAARRAVARGFVPTTSGAATGVAADPQRIAALRDALGADAPLAVASGIDPGNAVHFAPNLSHILVATGVSTSFHEFDPALLRALVATARDPS
jgi:predicted TIM-barrel enzyme